MKLEIETFPRKFLSGAVVGSGFALAVLAMSMVYASLNYSVQINTVSSGSGLSSSEWNKMVANFGTIDAQLTIVSSAIVPTGAILAFNLVTCPTWWSAADGTSGKPDLRGQFLRGMNTFDNGITVRSDNNQDPDCSLRSSGLCSLGSWQGDIFKSHTHTLASMAVATVALWGYGSLVQYGWATPIGATGWNETRPKNVDILFCIKN